MSTREERAKARASWPVEKRRLGEEPSVDTRDVSTPTERVALALQLTLEQWQLAGLPLPAYSRATMPGLIHRRTSK